MKNDEFEYLWEKVQKLESKVSDLQEAVSRLIDDSEKEKRKTQLVDMSHFKSNESIGPGYDNYGRNKDKKVDEVSTPTMRNAIHYELYTIPPGFSEEELEELSKRLKLK